MSKNARYLSTPITKHEYRMGPNATLNIYNIIESNPSVAFLRQVLYQSNTKRERKLISYGKPTYKVAGSWDTTSKFNH